MEVVRPGRHDRHSHALHPRSGFPEAIRPSNEQSAGLSVGGEVVGVARMVSRGWGSGKGMTARPCPSLAVHWQRGAARGREGDVDVILSSVVAISQVRIPGIIEDYSMGTR